MAIKKIAVIGAGYAGIAIVWHLVSTSDNLEVVLFDREGVAGGASGLSAGLLHCFAGAHSKLNKLGREGVGAAIELLTVAEAHGEDPVQQSGGILRLALTDLQRVEFAQTAALHDDVEWCDQERCQDLVPGVAPYPGIWIRSGRIVYPKRYLSGLWRACERLGARFERTVVNDLAPLLTKYDAVVVATGMDTKQYAELSHLPLNPVKGQLLELEWPAAAPPLSMPVNAGKYVTMAPDVRSCLAGATFERRFADAEVDQAVAEAEILPELVRMIPALAEAKVLGCRAGMRASTPNHEPIAGRFGEKLWVLTGLGSKGLLYHGLLARQVAEQVRVATGL